MVWAGCGRARGIVQHGSGVKRLLAVYLACFATSVALFALFSWFAPGAADEGSALSIWRLLLFVAASGCAVAAWASAIWVAVHGTIWPLTLAILTVCVATASIVLRHVLAS